MRRRAGSRGWTASTRPAASSAASISPRRPLRRPARRAPTTATVRLDRLRLRAERRHRGGAGEDAAGGGARRCTSGRQDATARSSITSIATIGCFRGPQPQGGAARSPCRNWCRTPTRCWARTGGKHGKIGRRPGITSPPVMLTVCNRTETAARIEHYFSKGDAHWPELHDAETARLRVDSKVLEKAEIGETATADKDYEAAPCGRSLMRQTSRNAQDRNCWH